MVVLDNSTKYRDVYLKMQTTDGLPTNVDFELGYGKMENEIDER